MSSAQIARDAARELAVPYRASTLVDAIVYMDHTEILAAFLADELLQAGMSVMNEGREILLLTSMVSSDGHFIFHQNVREKIKGKNVVLMTASLSTGATVNQVRECMNYYGCNLVGISAIFSVYSELDGREIRARAVANHRHCRLLIHGADSDYPATHHAGAYNRQGARYCDARTKAGNTRAKNNVPHSGNFSNATAGSGDSFTYRDADAGKPD
jgi:hypothetical protein